MREAAPPFLILLGFALPLTFLGRIDQYLNYLQPGELVAAYATAFLLLLALSLPLWLLAGAAFAALERVRSGRALRGALASVMLALAGAGALAVLCKATLDWTRSFTWSEPALAQLGEAPLAISLALGAGLVWFEGGRHIIARMSTLAVWPAALGALTLAVLPFSGWSGEAESSGSSFDAVAEPGPGGGSGGTPPHILLLTIDALSAEHMSLYGASRRTTPRLDAFAGSALTFDHAYANANFTTPGAASLLTGTQPWTHRALQLPAWPRSAPRRDALPQRLQRAGYQLGYVSTNPHAGAAALGLGGEFNFAHPDATRDFTLCADRFMRYLKYACVAAELPLLALYERLLAELRGRAHDNAHADPALATRPALAWLASVEKTRPVFLWVHLLPPHSPYAAPEPFLGRFDPSAEARALAHTEPAWGYLLGRLPPARVRTLAARYDESVLYVDHYGGEFLAQALAILGENTAVIVTADHGESFSHGYGAHTGPGLYEEIIHIPLIIRLPHQREAARSATPAQQIDIAPTIAALAGIPTPSSWEGRALVAASGTAHAARAEPHPVQSAPGQPIFSMNFEENARYAALTTGAIAAVEPRWKLVHYLGHLRYPAMPALHDELYDLAADPHETRELSSSYPAEAARLRALIDTELAKHAAPVSD